MRHAVTGRQLLRPSALVLDVLAPNLSAFRWTFWGPTPCCFLAQLPPHLESDRLPSVVGDPSSKSELCNRGFESGRAPLEIHSSPCGWKANATAFAVYSPELCSGRRRAEACTQPHASCCLPTMVFLHSQRGTLLDAICNSLRAGRGVCGSPIPYSQAPGAHRAQGDTRSGLNGASDVGH